MSLTISIIRPPYTPCPLLSAAKQLFARYSARGELSLPSMTLIGPGAEVLIADGDVEESDIEDALP